MNVHNLIIVHAHLYNGKYSFLVRKPADSCGISMSLETPQEVIFFRGGSSHARGKLPAGATLNARPTETHCSKRKRSFPQTKCLCKQFIK